METSNVIAITELPLEIHHKIGSCLSPKDLKSTSLVCWQFYHLYSWPLANTTVTRLDKFLTETQIGLSEKPTLRNLVCNVLMKSSTFQAVQKLGIDKESVRHVQIVLDEEFTDNIFVIFPNIAQLNLKFIEEFPSHLVFTAKHLEKSWNLPKLKVFETNYCGEQYISNINAPNLEKLVLRNMYNSYTLTCLKRFQTVSKIHVSSHKASFIKTAIEFFTQNFHNLKNLKIEQEGVLDNFQIRLVLNTVTKFQLSPISTTFKTLKVLGRFLQEDLELEDFDLEGYKRISYALGRKWQAEINGHCVEIVFEAVRT